MVLLVSSLLSLYLSSLVAFSFVTHPVSYCFLLLISAFSMACYTYIVLGFSWYMVLFCLVYVGGVYVLFIFVSLHNPNPTPVLGTGAELVLFLFIFLEIILSWAGYRFVETLCDASHYLCSYYEGYSYCFFCLILMLGFVVVSVVSSDKHSFCR